MKWLRETYPGIIATATVGGAHLSSGPAAAAKLRAAGYLNGIPDVLIFLPSGGKHGLFIEMKRPGATLRVEQAQVMADLATVGYATGLAHSLEEFQRCVTEYHRPSWSPSPAERRPESESSPPPE